MDEGETRRAEELMARAEAAMGADPRTSQIGMFVAFAEPPQLYPNVSTPTFMWFASERDATSVLCEVLPFTHAQASAYHLHVSAEGDALGRELQGAIDGRSLADAMEDINDAVGGAWDVMWVGALNDLAAGGGDWESSVRESFHSDDEDDVYRPISADEMDEFVTFLQTYGA